MAVFSSLDFISFYFILLFPLGYFHDFTYIPLIDLTEIHFISQLWYSFGLLFHFPIFSSTQSLSRMPDSFNYVGRAWHSFADRTWRSIPTDHLCFVLFHLLLKRGPDSQVEFCNYIL